MAQLVTLEQIVGLGQACNRTMECHVTSRELTCQDGICVCMEGQFNSALKECSAGVWSDVATMVLRFFLISFTIFITTLVLYLMFSHTVSSRWRWCRGRSSRAAATADPEAASTAPSELLDKPPSYEDTQQKPPSYQHAVEMEKTCNSADDKSEDVASKKPPDCCQGEANSYVLHI